MRARVTVTVEVCHPGEDRAVYTVSTTRQSSSDGPDPRTASAMRGAAAEALSDVERAVATRYPETDRSAEAYWYRPPLVAPSAGGSR